jgi:hypothetical protein
MNNYGGLKSSIASWLNRGDLEAQIPDFIKLAESDFLSELRHWRMLKRAYAPLAGEYTQYPTDLVEGVSVHLLTDPVRPLTVVSPVELLQKKPSRGGVAGRPVFAAFAGELQVLPVPDSDYEVEMLYFGAPGPLVGDLDSNWILTRFPGLYLYGALRAAAPYLHEDERVVVWEGLYQATLDKARRDHGSHSLSGSRGIGPQVVF